MEQRPGLVAPEGLATGLGLAWPLGLASEAFDLEWSLACLGSHPLKGLAVG